jgi:hypothetical protein
MLVLVLHIAPGKNTAAYIHTLMGFAAAFVPSSERYLDSNIPNAKILKEWLRRSEKIRCRKRSYNHNRENDCPSKELQGKRTF